MADDVRKNGYYLCELVSTTGQKSFMTLYSARGILYDVYEKNGHRFFVEVPPSLVSQVFIDTRRTSY